MINYLADEAAWLWLWIADWLARQYASVPGPRWLKISLVVMLVIMLAIPGPEELLVIAVLAWLARRRA